jgi:hypothetical protein
VAEVLLAEQHEAGRAERYLQSYLAQEPEGNQPTAAIAARELKRARNVYAGQPSNTAGSGSAK